MLTTNVTHSSEGLYDGWKMIALAARLGQQPVLGEALLALSDTLLLMPLSTDERAWIHLAAQQGNVEFIAAWIARELPIDLPTRQGFTPLHFAAAAGNERAVILLLDAGVAVSAKTGDGWTALDCAIVAHATPVALRLIERGASLSTPLPADGLTTLQRAVRENLPTIVEVMLQRNVDPNMRSAAGLTALDYAVQTGNEPLTALLRSHGAMLAVDLPLHQPEELAVRGWLPIFGLSSLPIDHASRHYSARFLLAAFLLVVAVLVILAFCVL
ncbi:MAG: ankyrin repeat domain-containing protein [Armatimonadota bacterium]